MAGAAPSVPHICLHACTQTPLPSPLVLDQYFSPLLCPPITYYISDRCSFLLSLNSITVLSLSLEEFHTANFASFSVPTGNWLIILIPNIVHQCVLKNKFVPIKVTKAQQEWQYEEPLILTFRTTRGEISPLSANRFTLEKQTRITFNIRKSGPTDRKDVSEKRKLS